MSKKKGGNDDNTLGGLMYDDTPPPPAKKSLLEKAAHSLGKKLNKFTKTTKAHALSPEEKKQQAIDQKYSFDADEIESALTSSKQAPREDRGESWKR